MRYTTSALLLVLSTLSGCDTLYGVSRSSKIDSLPSLDCISTVISTTRGIASVKKSVYAGGTAVTLSGLKNPASTSYNFLYHGAEGSHIVGVLQVLQDHTGYIAFSQSLQGINSRPAQEDIDATRPIMKQIEERIGAECAVTHLPTSIREHCRGVQCSPIEQASSATR